MIELPPGARITLLPPPDPPAELLALRARVEEAAAAEAERLRRLGVHPAEANRRAMLATEAGRRDVARALAAWIEALPIRAVVELPAA